MVNSASDYLDPFQNLPPDLHAQLEAQMGPDFPRIMAEAFASNREADRLIGTKARFANDLPEHLIISTAQGLARMGIAECLSNDPKAAAGTFASVGALLQRMEGAA